jgi:hypothetical protein
MNLEQQLRQLEGRRPKTLKQKLGIGLQKEIEKDPAAAARRAQQGAKVARKLFVGV